MTPMDPLFASQWYLTGPNGVNVAAVWDDYTGAGVLVAVFDTGVDAQHEDLDGNYSTALSVKAPDLSPGGLPETFFDDHGTLVAGIIAAENNGVGIVGVAYDATLISIYSTIAYSDLTTDSLNAFRYAANHADVMNNSWGYNNLLFDNLDNAFVDNFKSDDFSAAGQAVEHAGLNGRDGLGTIIVQSAGNVRVRGDDVNLHNFQNNRFTVAVAATLEDGTIAPYSTPGATILVSAPGGGMPGSIVTTDRTGSDGIQDGDYYERFNGTSAAAPMVSGVVALMLEANPDLGGVDVQKILAYTARQTGPAASYQHNGAQDWNGGGLHASHDFGFGLVDATAAVRLAESWRTQETYSTIDSLSRSFAVNQAIPDDDENGTSFGFSVPGGDGFDIHRVEIDLQIAHSFIGDLVVTLVSPSGTVSTLLNRPGLGERSSNGASLDNVDFVFGSAHFMGEDAGGTWTVNVSDRRGGDVGVFAGFKAIFYGQSPDADDTHIYTNEFAAFSFGPRGLLTDTNGGVDWLNVAAVGGDSIIDLTAGGSASRIAGRALTIDSGALIENAHGGDGDDRLAGNLAANELVGGRGADDLAGRAGDDTLLGGAGDDVLTGGADNDVMTGGAGNDSLIGGLGNDLYFVDDSGDVVLDLLGAGTDRIAVKNVDFTLGSDQSIELLTTNSSNATAALDLRGNALSQTIIGNNGANILHDGGTARGSEPGAGPDRLIGRGGDDTYVVYDRDDVIVERAGQGADRVAAGVDYALAEGVSVEFLNTTALRATYAMALTGNGFAQKIRGNDGDNRIDGGGGLDVLIGEGGADSFMFSTALGPNTFSAILDFSSSDAIGLDTRIFQNLLGPVLAQEEFVANTTGVAEDAADRIIYDLTTGGLFYDTDGAGTAFNAVRFAILAGAPALAATDFVLV